MIEYRRCFDKYKTIINPTKFLELIIKKINAPENTDFYQTLPKIWKNFLKDKDNEQRKKYLKFSEKYYLKGQ